MCPRCGETKPSHEFGRNWGALDGLQVYCSPCRSKYDRERRLRVEEVVLKVLGGKCACCSVDKLAFLAAYQRGEPQRASSREPKLQRELTLRRFEDSLLRKFIETQAEGQPASMAWWASPHAMESRFIGIRGARLKSEIGKTRDDLKQIRREGGHGPVHPRLPLERRSARLNPERTFYSFVLQEIMGYPWRREYRHLLVGGGIDMATQAKLDKFWASKGRGYGGFTPEGIERFFATLPKPEPLGDIREERERIRRARAAVAMYVILCANCSGEIARSGTCPHQGGKPLPSSKPQELEVEDVLLLRTLEEEVARIHLWRYGGLRTPKALQSLAGYLSR
jgi:hypothetical protein